VQKGKYRKLTTARWRWKMSDSYQVEDLRVDKIFFEATDILDILDTQQRKTQGICRIS
jgi:hypothetical protein